MRAWRLLASSVRVLRADRSVSGARGVVKSATESGSATRSGRDGKPHIQCRAETGSRTARHEGGGRVPQRRILPRPLLALLPHLQRSSRSQSLGRLPRTPHPRHPHVPGRRSSSSWPNSSAGRSGRPGSFQHEPRVPEQTDEAALAVPRADSGGLGPKERVAVSSPRASTSRRRRSRRPAR